VIPAIYRILKRGVKPKKKKNADFGQKKRKAVAQIHHRETGLKSNIAGFFRTDIYRIVGDINGCAHGRRQTVPCSAWFARSQ